MELRNDKDVINAKKMGAEGGPPIFDDNLSADSNNEKKKKKEKYDKQNKQ